MKSSCGSDLFSIVVTLTEYISLTLPRPLMSATYNVGSRSLRHGSLRLRCGTQRSASSVAQRSAAWRKVAQRGAAWRSVAQRGAAWCNVAERGAT